jgi:hypothetical protein
VALLASFHPYQIPTIWLGLLIFTCPTVVSSHEQALKALLTQWKHRIWLILIPLPVVLYFAWLFHFVEGFASWRSQPPDVPPLWSFPFHLGPLLLVGLWSRKHFEAIGKHPQARVCGALFLSNLLIVHSPVVFGWSRQADVPLIGLGMLFLAPAVNAKWQHIRRHGSPLWSKRLVFILLILALGDSALLLAKRTATAQRVFPFQVPVNLLKVFQAVDRQSDFTTVVLSDPEIGGLIPRYAGARSLLGHPQVTSSYSEKAARYQSILKDPANAESRDEFLREYNVSYWIVTPRSDPAALDLPLLFEAGDYRLRGVGE